ncbi:hypothetical protein E3N88_21517 [Mikania micrantha]|uniref:Uncharacterized protein n=1 Tax=Mikania micrantha TaxID=192012 RepID=A0A5N6NKG0_9ASTR|nr:hypothetical protein E3N88_21517 [Mikania micrantha]
MMVGGTEANNWCALGINGKADPNTKRPGVLGGGGEATETEHLIGLKLKTGLIGFVRLGEMMDGMIEVMDRSMMINSTASSNTNSLLFDLDDNVVVDNVSGFWFQTSV